MLASSCFRLRISFWWSSVRSLSCSSRRSHLNAQTQKTHVRRSGLMSLRKETHAGISRNRASGHLTTWHLTGLMTRPDKIRACLLICWSSWPIRGSQQDQPGQWEVSSRRRGMYTAVQFGSHIQLDAQHRTRIDWRKPSVFLGLFSFLLNFIEWYM